MRRATILGIVSVGSGLWLLWPGCTRATGAPTGETVLTVEVGDRFAFEPGQLHCRAGQPVRLRLKIQPQSGASDLVHNIALLAAGTDADAFGRAALEAPAEENYVPAEFRHRVLAVSDFVGEGGVCELVFVAPAKPGDHPIVCTFPGHCMLGMKGRLIVE